MQERLQKIIARAGIASRRRAEDLILSGQVEVNGKVVTELGSKADPEHDSIRVSGHRVKMPQRRLSLILNKPDACVSAMVDPAGRTTLRDFLSGVSGRVFPVGGLEYHATGLVVLTTDGAFASRLFSALGKGMPQTFHVKIKAPLSSDEMQALRREFGRIESSRTGPNPWYEVRLPGARLTRLRNALHEAGHPVEKLKRIAISRIELGDLETGRWRPLSEAELRGIEHDIENLPGDLLTRPPAASPARSHGFEKKPRRGQARWKSKKGGQQAGQRRTKPAGKRPVSRFSSQNKRPRRRGSHPTRRKPS